MKNYEKPIILANSELSEGVYAASGKNPSYSEPIYKLTNSWDGNKQYDVTFTNTTGEKVDSVSITIPVYGTVTGIGGNVTSVNNGDGTWTLTFNNYGNGIEANTTLTVYVHVTGTGEFGFGN